MSAPAPKPSAERAGRPLPQGDLALLGTAEARKLLTSQVPARLAYVARDGTPRVYPTHLRFGRTICPVVPNISRSRVPS